MNELRPTPALIPTTRAQLAGGSRPAVNARDLHRFLDVGRDFSSWLRGRIEDYGYQKGRDYVENFDSPVLGNQVGHGGVRRSLDYLLSLDMAKELSMLERNSMGRLARQYFIRCEAATRDLLPRLAGTLLASNPRWRAVARYKELGLSHSEIARLQGVQPQQIRRCVRDMEAAGLLAPPATLAAHQAQARAWRQRIDDLKIAISTAAQP